MPSRLFLNLMCFVCVPLFLGMAIVCAMTTGTISSTLPDWLADVEQVSVALERDGIRSAVALRAGYANEVLFRPTRDLFMLTRFMGWCVGVSPPHRPGQSSYSPRTMSTQPPTDAPRTITT
jgi:hypothetical protein